jgi:hypothetical protein
VVTDVSLWDDELHARPVFGEFGAAHTACSETATKGDEEKENGFAQVLHDAGEIRMTIKIMIKRRKFQ